MESTTNAAQRRLSVALFAMPLLAALVFRLKALAWGLPLRYAHIDESVVTFYSLKLAGGDFQPVFFDYPSFFLNLLAGAFRVAAGVGSLTSGLSFDDHLLRYDLGDASFFTLTARGLSVCFALGTIALMVDAGRKQWSRAAALTAALCLALNPLHLRHSHYGTVDTAATLLTFWAMLRIADFSVRLDARSAAESGVLVGLAAATKYFPGILLVPLLAVPFWRTATRPARLAALAALGAFAGFALGSPATLLAFPEFASRFGHLAPKIIGVPGHAVPLLPTLGGLWNSLGLLFPLGIVGLVLDLRRGGGRRVFAVLWLCLFAFVGLWATQSPHYALSLYPGLLLMGAAAVERFGRERTWVRPALLSALVLLCVPGALREIRYLSVPDTRLRAGAWLRTHLPAKSNVLRFAHTPEFRRDDPFRVKVDFTNTLLSSDLSAAAIAELTSYDVVIYSGYMGDADPVAAALEKRFPLIHRESGPPPRFPHHPVVSVFQTGAFKRGTP